jgi:hypothetical protein
MRSKTYVANIVFALILSVSVAFLSHAQEMGKSGMSMRIPKGAKIFVAPIADGFDTYLRGAIADKKVPVEVVASRDLADFEIAGTSETQKSTTAQKIILGKWHSREEASISLSNLKSSEVIWSYSVHKEASAHGKKSTAEACAKHLKDEAIEK